MLRTLSCVSLLALLAVVCLIGSPAAAQQNLPVPEQSPAASVTQTVGITEITISYHRPAVRARAIWGALVPYNAVWRAGANENTTIRISDPVMIQGKPLPAGTYGLHMIPGEKEWTIIFSKNSTSWGSYSYDQKEDALRVTTVPEQTPLQEWLSYQIEPAAAGSATISLRWEKLKVPFRAEVDIPATVLRKAREEYLRGLARFGWQGWYQAANYCAMQKLDLDEALSWIDRSIQMNKNFANLWVKADLLMQTGKKDQAAKMKQDALAVGTEAAVNTAGYQYLGAGRVSEAIELFSLNVEKYPDSWNVFDSLAEGYATQGDKAKAKEYYSKALSKVTDEDQKARIRQAISVLGSQ